MVTTLRINNGKAKVLFDTGTTGTHQLSNAFVQTNGIQTEAMQPPVIIRLATKGSKTVAKDQVTCTVGNRSSDQSQNTILSCAY
jgi:hypothetical protein